MSEEQAVYVSGGLLRRASGFAKQAHDARGQVRKYTGEPYWFHCREVARIVELAGGDDAMIAAAWLHDTIEDCGVTRAELESLFGDDVATLVWWLTDASTREDGNREARKAIDRDHIRRGPDRAKIVKMADLISNTHSISLWDSSFAKVYLKEKKSLLPLLDAADWRLGVAAWKAVEFAEAMLAMETMANALKR